jgi:hypothetical protein
VVSDGQGGAIIVWLDGRNDTGGIEPNMDTYAQDLTSDGQRVPGWRVDGLPLCTDPSKQSVPLPITDGAGGVIVTWADGRNTSLYHIYAQRITSTGTIPPGWPIDGLPVCTAGAFQDASAIAEDGAGGAIIAWRDTRNGNVYESDIFAQHITGSGTIVSGWNVDGNPVCAATSDQHSPSLVPQGPSMLVAWQDFRSGASADSADVYAQSIMLDGSIATGWPLNGIPVCTAPSKQSYIQAATDGAGGAIVTWVDARSGADDIYAQHVRSSGSVDPSWPANGVAVCAALNNQTGQWAVSDGSRGVILAWEDLRNGTYPDGFDIYAARLFVDGRTPVLLTLISVEASPERVRLVWHMSETSGGQLAVERASSGGGWVMIEWVEPDASGHVVFEDREVAPGHRYGYRLRAPDGSIAHQSPETWVDVPARRRISLEPIRPNPSFGEMVVRFVLATDDPATLDLVDLQGRALIRRHIEGLQAGEHAITLTADPKLAAGTYLLRLRQGDRAITRRVSVRR